MEQQVLRCYNDGHCTDNRTHHWRSTLHILQVKAICRQYMYGNCDCLDDMYHMDMYDHQVVLQLEQQGYNSDDTVSSILHDEEIHYTDNVPSLPVVEADITLSSIVQVVNNVEQVSKYITLTLPDYVDRDAVCPICQNTYTGFECSIGLPCCSKWWHLRCAKKYIESTSNNVSCPNCRMNWW